MRTLSTFLLLGLLSNNPLSYANTHEHDVKHELSNKSTIQVLVKNAPIKIMANTTETIHFQLLKNNKPLTLEDLKTVHTQKVHLMIIDPTLTEYYHMHPVMDNKSKDFIFKFSPKKNGSYRIWVDVTPIVPGKQVFLYADIGSPSPMHAINKEVKLNYRVNSYQFNLKLDKQPQVGKPVMATITVTEDDKPFTNLEPIMGAFAHLVGFNADYSSIVHIHPMGKEPSKETEHGGPQLMFHLEPQKAGFVKLFAQFRINGKDIYVPFGVAISQ